MRAQCALARRFGHSFFLRRCVERTPIAGCVKGEVAVELVWLLRNDRHTTSGTPHSQAHSAQVRGPAYVSLDTGCGSQQGCAQAARAAARQKRHAWRTTANHPAKSRHSSNAVQAAPQVLHRLWRSSAVSQLTQQRRTAARRLLAATSSNGGRPRHVIPLQFKRMPYSAIRLYSRFSSRFYRLPTEISDTASCEISAPDKRHRNRMLCTSCLL